MPEDFLHYIWKFGLFNKSILLSTDSESIEIVHPGQHNLDSGPDFSNARVRIGGTLWIGNVEIHTRSSLWYKHQHHNDPSYDNVVLHVVEFHDQEIVREDGSKVPVLELANLIPEGIAERYLNLMQSLKWIPCQDEIATLDRVYVYSCLSRVLMERLERKSLQVYEVLQQTKGNWDEAFYIMLARNFGFKTNALPFEMLARSLPSTLFAKYQNRPLQVEALVFGQAGFLQKPFTDLYPAELRKEYLFLKKKHKLVPIDHFVWKYMRLRPQNFPTRRLAQFAAMMQTSERLLSKILEFDDVKNILQIFKIPTVNPYWKDHYRFEEKAPPSAYAGIGNDALNNILINTVAIFLMAFGTSTGKSKFTERSLDLLELLVSENNSVVKGFKKIGVIAENAVMSQGLLELKRNYCDEKKCLYCGLGNKLINT